MIFVRHKKVVWELSEHYRIRRAIHRSTAAVTISPILSLLVKTTRFWTTTAQKLCIKEELFTVWILTSTFFNCVLDDGIIKVFSVAFYLFIALLVLFLFYIPQIYLSRILSDWSKIFFPPENSRLWFKNKTQIHKIKGSKFPVLNLICILF